MGAGALPLEDGGAGHPPRPPIPIVPIDPAAAQAVLVRVSGAEPARRTLAAWLAACGARPPGVVHAVRTAWDGAAATPPLDVPLVAAAVDAGREAAADARRTGADVLLVRAGAGALDALDDALAAGEAPLRTLRRHGAPDLCVACGLALGAGEQGLAYLGDDRAAACAGRLATRIEPVLAARVRAADPPGTGEAALAAALAVLAAR